MSTIELAVMRRKHRRTHLAAIDVSGVLRPMCNTRTSTADAEFTPVPLNGGATTRLRNDLTRELDANTCIPCTLIAYGMLALYVSRDTGKAW